MEGNWLTSKGFVRFWEGSKLEGRTEAEASIQGYSVHLDEAPLEVGISAGMGGLLGPVLFL